MATCHLHIYPFIMFINWFCFIFSTGVKLMFIGTSNGLTMYATPNGTQS